MSGIGIVPVIPPLPRIYDNQPPTASTFNQAMAAIERGFNLSDANEGYAIQRYFPGTYSNGQTLDIGFFGFDVTFPLNMSQCVGGCVAHPTSPATVTIRRDGTIMATMSITVGGALTFSKQGPFTYGGTSNLYTVVAQASADATFGGLYFTLQGTSS